jgi:flagellar biosynthetic protein FlhB
MADDGSGEKTEEPTQKKIQDARKKGQVWKSRDFASVAVFVTGLGVLKVFYPTLRGKISELFQLALKKLAHPEDYTEAASSMLMQGVITLLYISVPVVVTAAVVAALTEFVQVGALFAPDAIKPKLEKLNPIQGFKNMFSKKQFVELIKNVVKVSVTAYVVYDVVRDALDIIALSVRSDEHMLVDVIGELVFRIAVRVSLLFIVFAIFDIWWHHRVYHKDLMMTKDEVKREYKETEGDPYHKAARKQLHHEILEGSTMQNVREADVVVTNPEHVAVALQYKKDSDGAPRVVCKGVDSRAAAIRELAKEADVPMLRNVPLAHALLRLDVGDEIPEELYDAVAEVMNFVYALRDQKAASA